MGAAGADSPRLRTAGARRRPALLALLAAGLLLASTLARANEAPAAAPRPFVLASDVPDSNVSRTVARIYVEAFRRLGLPVEFTEHALPRRAALTEAGAIDGEMGRIRDYADAHPNLVRVDESIFVFSFALFARNPEIRLASLDDLAGRPFTVEYRRGILLCERELRKRVPPERVSDVVTIEQGVKKLVAGRTDVYCDLDEYLVQPVLRRVPGGDGVRRVLRFATLPTYPFLARKHAALAPRLAAVLRQMKAEGVYEAILREGREQGD